MRDCAPCPLKPRCRPNAPARKVLRSIYEGARDLARQIAKTDDYQTSRLLKEEKGSEPLRRLNSVQHPPRVCDWVF